MIWEFCRVVTEYLITHIKILFCPFVMRYDEEYICTKKPARFVGYYSCDGKCPGKKERMR